MQNRDLWRYIQNRRYQFGLAAVLVLALFMRFYHLASLPPGLHPDEAANGLDMFRILEHHQIQPFFATNGGREALFFYFQAFFVNLIGNTILALRIAPALIGTAAVAAVYLWGAEWFGKRTGLLAAGFMAVTPWAVIISRDGFRAGMVALMVPLTLWLYTKALRTNAREWYIAAGVSLGAGFYTYTAFRLFPLILIAMLGYMMARRRTGLRRRLPQIATSVGVALIVLIPLIIYGIHYPGQLFGRAGGVSFTNPSINNGKPLAALANTFVKTALMFNFHGDPNYRQNLGGQPELSMFTGVMFILGIFVSIARRKRALCVGLLLTFVVMLLPELLTAEGIPHAMRAIGALPATLLLAALGTDYLLSGWYRVFPLNVSARAGATIAVAVLFALTAYQGYVEYFVAWASAPQTYDAYSEDTTQLAYFFNQDHFRGVRYAIGGQYSLMPVQYLTHRHTAYMRIDTPTIQTVAAPPGRALQFSILEGDRQAAVRALKTRFPTGYVSPHYSSFSDRELFVIYTVPAG